jgi:hypothetical protein
MKHIMDRRLNRKLALRLHASPSGMRLLLGLSIAAITTPVKADGGIDVGALQVRAAGSAGGTATDPNGAAVLPCAMAPARTSELGVQVRC